MSTRVAFHVLSTNRILYAGLAGIISASCALSSTPAGSSRSSHRLGAEEISSVSYSTAYEAVQMLRPRWLLSRGLASLADPNPSYPVVIVDNVQRGELDLLRSIRAEVVAEIRYVNARDATTRYGTGFVGGAIEVTTLSTLPPDTTERR
jgi:hypothetical protein